METEVIEDLSKWMLVLEVLFKKYGISLYDQKEWDGARVCAAKRFEEAWVENMNALFRTLRVRVGMREPTFSQQYAVLNRLTEEIDALKARSFKELESLTVKG